MTRTIEIRRFGATAQLFETPLYGDELFAAHLVLGERAKLWNQLAPGFERDGMPQPRRSVGGLYFLPAVISYFHRREGMKPGFDYDEDGPENFGP